MPRIPPPEVVAKWPKPNYDHPESRGHWLIGVEIGLFALTFIVVVLRIYVRGRIIRSFGVDDWLIIAATVVCGCTTIATCLATLYGYGIHIWDIRPHLRGISLRFAWANMLLFTTTVVLTKLSMLFFYLRLAATKPFRRWTYLWIGFVVAWGVSYFFVLLFLCTPIQAYWHPMTMSQKKCINESAAMVTNSAFNIVADLGLMVLPMPMIWSVKLPAKQRLGLVAMFGLGTLVVVAGFMRLKYLVETTNSNDPTWEGFMAWIWVAIECDVGIICASIPSLKPLVAKSREISHNLSSRSRRGGGGVKTANPISTVNHDKPSNSNAKGISARLSRIIPNNRSQGLTKLESNWDYSDECIAAPAQTYQLSTVVAAGKSANNGSDDDEKHDDRRITYVERRKMRTPEPIVHVDEVEKNMNDSDSERDIEHGWDIDVVKTTKIEVVSQAFSDDDTTPSGPGVSGRNMV